MLVSTRIDRWHPRASRVDLPGQQPRCRQTDAELRVVCRFGRVACVAIGTFRRGHRYFTTVLLCGRDMAGCEAARYAVGVRAARSVAGVDCGTGRHGPSIDADAMAGTT